MSQFVNSRRTTGLRARLAVAVMCLGALLLAPVTAGCAQASVRPVTLESLLLEMVDRDAPAMWASPAYTGTEMTSHDPRKKNPADLAGWHSNQDYGNFIRTEVNDGRKEWVILDAKGPGAITRIWVPLSGDKDSQVIRFYLDGLPTPAITAKLNDLISGQSFVRPPLAFTSWNETDLHQEIDPDFHAPRGVGGDFYLPIPFAHGCKITLDQAPFYYHIGYRLYRPGTRVKSFTMDDLKAAAPVLARVSKDLMGGQNPGAAGPGRQATIQPGQTLALNLPAGSAAVRDIQVRLDPQDAPGILRSLVIQATFDGENTIWCPVGDFFGAGVRLNPVEDWDRTVTGDGTLVSRWVMPYEKTGRVSLENIGPKPVTVRFAARTRPWKWDSRSMHFHATWHCQLDLKTRPMSDWNYVTTQGQGIYVGDTLTVFSPVKPWYGEGDERIYLDGERVASQIGTGTEDYYGYAWGMPDFFDSTFISTPRRDFTSRDDWRGYTTTSRLRLLDGIPFRTSIRTDMEIWNWADTQVDYAVAAFWYARPGATSNRYPEPSEAIVPLQDVPPDPSQFKIAGAIECETMKVVASSPGLPIETQNAGLQQGQWSNGQQLFAHGSQPGGFVELEIPVPDGKAHTITLYGTRAKDYGILRFTVNGHSAGKDFDGYNLQAIPSGPIDLGAFKPSDGKLLLKVEVVGSNGAAVGGRYYFGLDCVVLH